MEKITKAEMLNLIDELRCAYSFFYRTIKNEEEYVKIVVLWHRTFENYTNKQMCDAVRSYIENEKETPTIAGIKNYIVPLVKKRNDF